VDLLFVIIVANSSDYRPNWVIAPHPFTSRIGHPFLSFSLVLAMPSDFDRAMSSLSINSTSSQPEDDWDRSLLVEMAPVEIPVTPVVVAQLSSITPRNSVVFPAEGTPGRTTGYSSSALPKKSDSMNGLEGGNKKRTLSDLLKLHSEKGSVAEFSPEEATRIADVLGQWVCRSIHENKVSFDKDTSLATD